jgi:hypothetical protein
VGYLLTKRRPGLPHDTGLLVAAPGADGCTVDDMVVPRGEWPSTGQKLWHALPPSDRSGGASCDGAGRVLKPRETALARLDLLVGPCNAGGQADNHDLRPWLGTRCSGYAAN